MKAPKRLANHWLIQTMHIIHPTGFPFSPKALKRGALDYLHHAAFTEHDSYAHFDAWRRDSDLRLVLLPTKAPTSAYAVRYLDDDVLLLGRESAGVPAGVAADAGLAVRIPMRHQMRSLNVAVAASLVLGECLRQTGAFDVLT